jgi:hypothetical protein
MQNAAAGVTLALSDERNLNHQAIVSELVSLIERIQASMKLIELALAREVPAAARNLPPTSSSSATSRRAT